MKLNLTGTILLLTTLLLASHNIGAAPLGTAFTYQGELKVIPGGNDIVIPANAAFDFEFELYDAQNNGLQVGPTVLLNNIQVAQGVFTVELDFGMSPFVGDQLYLAISLRDGNSNGSFSDLSPRQKLTAAPYALHAEYVAAGTVGSVEVNPTQVQLRVLGTCPAGSFITSVNQNGTVVCEDDADEQSLSLVGSQLSISNGNSIDLANVSGDNDDSNELNTGLTLNGTTLTVTDAGGDLNQDLASIDTDDQTLSLNGNQLSISDGNTVDLGTVSGDNDDSNELNTGLALNGTTLTVTDAGGDLSQDLASIDTDDQTLSFDGSQLSISEGNSADLSALINDDDNELQTLSFDGSQLSISDGNSANLSSLINNDSNELQDLNLSNDQLGLSGSLSTVDLSGYLDNTDAQTLSLVDNDLSISGGNAVSLAALFNDNDATNELNTGLDFTNTTLTVTDAGGDLTVDLSGLSDTGAQILAKLITVDGAGSGLDADLLDGLEASDIIAAAGGGDNRTPISSIPFTITEPGSYYLTGNLSNTTLNSDGIIIDTDNVTLDLGGFTISGYDTNDPPNQTGDDGIYILGSQNNIHIFNGHVEGWAGDGINALNADHSIFERLTVSYNGGDGLVADFSAVISHVTAGFNGLDGIEGDDGTVIVFSTAMGNGDNGIQTSEGSHVAHSTGFDNESDGIDVGAGSTVTNSVASDNLIFGIDLALGGTVQMSTAYDNERTGIDVASASIVRNNVVALNGGSSDPNLEPYNISGIRTFANSWIINNKAHENDGAGIWISSTDTLVEGNSITDNDNGGLVVTTSGSLILNNKAAGNFYPDGPDGTTYDDNFELNANSNWGPIVDLTGVGGDISSVPNSDHPFANFVY
ncbi:beta strand repeat-containing protein [Marinicella sediminis]|uniref:Beta strand repeat-containing protein n=1 Tax=Marinicella sediminis TaxID=1792834 RepID=A0ABV7J7X6_9GAMM|nr:right-handed parallel beta-helix repeat-containing protein [Marinicella sediminis]